MPSPLVSVVIPAWNVEPWIAETLGSVLLQSYPKQLLEIVVVDDGSTDGTATVVKGVLQGSGIRSSVIETAGPRGVSAARNQGWKAASGSWVQFLDADDLLEPGKIALQIRAGEQLESSVAVVFSKWGRLACRNGHFYRQQGVVAPVLGQDPVADLLQDGNFIHLGSQLIRRAWLERVGGFDESHCLVEDVELHLRVAMAGGTLCSVPAQEPVFWYRQRPGSASRLSELELVRARIRNSLMVEKHWRAEGSLSEGRVAVLISCYAGPLRFFAESCPAEFESLLAHVYDLDPRFVPSRPLSLHYLSRFVGYRRAETVATRYRQVKQRVWRMAAES